ncbi:MAG: sigma-70 family RNA polymerase sigma factor [Planctomycetes bacterium]|nr:sigma-70 family RNA polymerase sigma factor [Planctomycetota bacterium]
MSTFDTVTALLQRMRNGDAAVVERLTELIYDELRRLSSLHLRGERQGHTLQTTALANEAWLRLVDQREVECHDRAHFLALASTAIRRILIDHARRAKAERRGGGRRPVSLESIDVAAAIETPDLVLALDDALRRLGDTDARKARVVELRYFAGLTIEQTAAVLRVSTATVERDWNMARAWLFREVDGGVD